MRRQFQEILALVRAGEPAERSFTVEDTEYVRNFYPRERLILLGCGHVSQPVCQYAADLGFAVTVADDRPSFANHTRFPQAEKVICDSFENAVMRDAYNLIGTGQKRCVTVDMSNDVAEEEGMVCGGQIKVLIEDVVE